MGRRRPRCCRSTHYTLVTCLRGTTLGVCVKDKRLFCLAVRGYLMNDFLTLNPLWPWMRLRHAIHCITGIRSHGHSPPLDGFVFQFVTASMPSTHIIHAGRAVIIDTCCYVPTHKKIKHGPVRRSRTYDRSYFISGIGNFAAKWRRKIPKDQMQNPPKCSMHHTETVNDARFTWHCLNTDQFQKPARRAMVLWHQWH